MSDPVEARPGSPIDHQHPSQAGRVLHPPIVRRRADGWPLCPHCGDDEAYSLATPADPTKLDGCYRCGRFPLTEEQALRAAFYNGDVDDEALA